MFMRYLGGGVGHRIWHLLPQPPAIPSRKKTQFPDPEETSRPEFPITLKRKRKALAKESDDSESSSNEDENDDENEDEMADFDYRDPDEVVEEDDEEDWVDEDFEDDAGPEGEENEVFDDDYDLRGFAEL